MLAKSVWAGGAAFSELNCCIDFCASGLRNSGCHIRGRLCSGDDRKRRLWALVHSCPDLREAAGVARCSRTRDGFLEGADGEGSASDCLAPAHDKEEISVLWNLLQDIEPLDVTRVGQDVSSDSKDAMKRTISGMLGLLPSDRFQVTVKTSHEPLMKLLISSVMTGYTLRNAEYRVSLQRSLGLAEACEKSNLQRDNKHSESCTLENPHEREMDHFFDGRMFLECDFSLDSASTSTPEVERYINSLKSKLLFVTKELEDYKRKSAATGMNSLAGEEKNDLLDYLRSLDTEKVSELSRPKSSEVEDMIRQCVSRCFQSLTASDCPVAMRESVKGVLEPEEMHSQSSITTTRDQLARLLFWCMLFGHHIRGLEYRLELSRSLRLCGDVDFP